MSGNMCISHVYGVRPFFAMPLCEGAAVCIESYASHICSFELHNVYGNV